MEPVAEVLAGERSSRAGQRGSYGIDGGFAGPAVFGVVEAGLIGTVAWAVRHRRPAVAALAAAGGAVVAGSAASYLYSTGPGKRAIWRSCWMSWACEAMSTCWTWDAAAARC